MTSDHVGIGIVGSGFIARAHAEASAAAPCHPARCGLAVSGQRSGVRRALGDSRLVHRFPRTSRPTRRRRGVHRGAERAAPRHRRRRGPGGKHVICEKPLARTLREADEMISACAAAGVLLMYAEEICFAPKYVRAKELADEGALGEVYLVRQTEQHYGPHSDWFWDPEQSGGGVLMDMGCHGIEFARWVLGKPAARTVAAEAGTFVHGGRTRAEDHAIVTIRFDGNRMGLVEASWAKPGGMDDRAEIVGSRGSPMPTSCAARPCRRTAMSATDMPSRRHPIPVAGRSPSSTSCGTPAFRRDGSLRQLRPRRGDTAGDRCGRPRGTRADLRGLPGRAQGRVELPLELSEQEAAQPPFALW